MRELGPALFLLRARRGTVPGLPALPGEIASAVLAITRGVACSMCAAPVLVDERTSLVPSGHARWLHASFGGVLCAALPRGRVRLRLASAVPPPARDGLVPLPLNEWTRVDGGARGVPGRVPHLPGRDHGDAPDAPVLEAQRPRRVRGLLVRPPRRAPRLLRVAARLRRVKPQMPGVGLEPTRVTTSNLKSDPLDQLGQPGAC